MNNRADGSVLSPARVQGEDRIVQAEGAAGLRIRRSRVCLVSASVTTIYSVERTVVLNASGCHERLTAGFTIGFRVGRVRVSRWGVGSVVLKNRFCKERTFKRTFEGYVFCRGREGVAKGAIVAHGE